MNTTKPNLSALSNPIDNLDIIGPSDMSGGLFEQDADFLSDYHINLSLLDIVILILVAIASYMMYLRYQYKNSDRTSTKESLWKTFFRKCYSMTADS